MDCCDDFTSGTSFQSGFLEERKAIVMKIGSLHTNPGNHFKTRLTRGQNPTHPRLSLAA